jgi:hypothetical protein
VCGTPRRHRCREQLAQQDDERGQALLPVDDVVAVALGVVALVQHERAGVVTHALGLLGDDLDVAP